MHGRLRVDVVEGEGEFVLEDGVRRNFPAQDPGEDVAFVIGGAVADRHSNPPRFFVQARQAFTPFQLCLDLRQPDAALSQNDQQME